MSPTLSASRASAPPLAPRFDEFEAHLLPVIAERIEEALLEQAFRERGASAFWQGEPAIVVPLSYRRHAGFDAACEASAARGLPVRVRRSGGGAVPQGPGIWNLTLAYRCAGGAHGRIEAVYQHLCAHLSTALDVLGIPNHLGEVQGSFCDGRFNLAVGNGASIRKIAGTAQFWSRHQGQHAVLAHALLLVDADLARITAELNGFEQAIGRGQPYREDRITSIRREQQARGVAFQAHEVEQALAGSLRRGLVTAGGSGISGT